MIGEHRPSRRRFRSTQYFPFMPAEDDYRLDESSWHEAARFWRGEVDALALEVGQSREMGEFLAQVLR